MFQGKVNAALRLLDKSNSGGVLPLSPETMKELILKHPPGNETHDEVLIDGEIPFVEPVMFENINEQTIEKAALRTKGASGPFGLDADGWKKILVSKNFGKPGTDLRIAPSKFARTVLQPKLPLSKQMMENQLQALEHILLADSFLCTSHQVFIR